MQKSVAWAGILVVVAAATLVLLLPGCELSSANVGVENRAPDFELFSLDGQKVRLSDLKGKTVVLNLWATWCPFCVNEMPALEAAYQKYQAQGVVVLAVNVQESQDRVSRFTSRFGLTFPVLLDPDGKVSKAYRVRGLPTTFFIDRNGLIKDQQIGELTSERIVDGISAAR